MNAYADRKSRWELGESQKARLTERDYHILKLLFDFGYLTSEMLREFVAPKTKPKHFSIRLKTLRDRPNLYIRRPTQQQQNHQANYSPLAYEITGRGTAALLTAGVITEEEAVWRSRFLQGKHLEFWHDLAMANVLASIKLAAERTGKRFIEPWRLIKHMPDRQKLQKNPLALSLGDRSIIPDYLFGIEHQVGQTFKTKLYWYEHDQGTEPAERKASSKLSSFGKKLKECEIMLSRRLYDSDFNLDGITVLTVTLTKRHLASIMAKAKDLPHRKHFAFMALNAATPDNRVPKPVPEVFRAQWQRAALDPIRIDQP